MRKLFGIMTAVVFAVLVMLYGLWLGDLRAQNLNQPNQCNLNNADTLSSQCGALMAQPGNFRNLLIGGDFSTNLWQRATSTASISTTATFTADRFFAYASTLGDVTVSRQTATPPTHYTAYLRLARSSGNASTGTICLAQIVEGNQAIRLRGKDVVFSFVARAGAAFSPNPDAVTARITTGSVADEGAAALTAGTWTTQANTVNGRVAINTGWQRYSVHGIMPSTVNEVAAQICFTPVGTAGATDYVDLEALQLEQASFASEIERRDASTEALLQQRYAQVVPEAPNNTALANGLAISTTVCSLTAMIPTTMRVTPSLTISLGSWSVTKSDGTKQSLTTLAASGQLTGTINLAATAASATLVAGNACKLVGGGGFGYIQALSEL